MRKFEEVLGLVVKFQQGQPISQISMLQDLGVRWVRDALVWEWIESTPGLYAPFSPELKIKLDYLRDHDIGFIALLTLRNSLAYPYSPYNPWCFGLFAAEMSRRLKAHGVKFVIEVGNEPHNDFELTRMGGLWWGAADRSPTPPPAAWVDRYAHMCRGAYQLVKAVDPAIKLMSQDDMWLIQYWMLEAGLPMQLDALSVHPYNGSSPPELSAATTNNPDYRPFVVCDDDRSFTSCVRRLKEQGLKKLGRTPEIWITEWAWSVGGMTQETVSAYLQRAFILAYAAGVEVMCWFSSWDGPDGPWGLLDNAGQERKTYTAYKTLASELKGFWLEREIEQSPLPLVGVKAFLFENETAKKLVVWSADATVRTLRFPNPVQVGLTPVFIPIQSEVGLDAAIAGTH